MTVALLKAVRTVPKWKVKAELPMLLFNKVCLGYIHNDWVAVISSLYILITSLTNSFPGSSISRGSNP